MDVTATTTSLASNTVSFAEAETDVATAASDFETFLTLLTAQMRNQDPLEPVDSTEYVAQLASFSAVEQQVATNEKLDALLAAFAVDEAAELTTCIGRSVDAERPVIFEGTPLDISFPPAPEATQHAVVIRNADGAIVHREPIAGDATSVVWPGTVTGGTAPIDTTYTVARESTLADGSIETATGRALSTVTEVRITDAGPVLRTESGAQSTIGEITALR